MKSNFYSAAIYCLAIVMLASCGNKENDIPKTSAELLAGDVSKSWLFKEGTLVMSGSINQTFDMKQQLSACEVDNLTIYKKDGKISQDEGTIKCAPSDPSNRRYRYLGTFNRCQAVNRN